MIVTGQAATGGSYSGSHVPLPTAPISRPGSDVITRTEAARAWKSPIVLREPTKAERIAAREAASRKVEHGTPSGHWWHRSQGERPCESCRAALAEARRRKRNEKLAANPPSFDVAAAAADYRAGMTIPELRVKYEVSDTTMRRNLEVKYGIRPERVVVDKKAVLDLHEQGLTGKEIAVRLECSYAAVYKHVTGAGLVINGRATAVDEARLRALYTGGMPIAQLAREFGIGRETVRRRLGLRDAT